MSGIDIYSQTWAAVRGHAEARLAQLRAELEADGTGHERTVAIRGGINELKAILALAEPAPPIPTSTASYLE